jgi:hypothetical protein
MAKAFALVFLPLALALAGCGDYGGSGSAGEASAGPTGAPPAGSPPGTAPPPTSGAETRAASVTAYSQTVYPIVRQYCATCHAGAGPGSPSLAHPNIDTSFDATVNTQKVNFTQPSRSRLVRRLAADFHYCWSDCLMNGLEMEAAIAAWAQLVAQTAPPPGGTPGGTPGGGGPPGGGTVDLIASAPLGLSDGVEDLGAERYREHLIAFWDFKEGSGNVARDTSGVAPAMDLTLTGVSWMSNYGIEIETGRASATRTTSRKLYDRIANEQTGTQQYSVEAWVIPANTTQEGPARIVTYSSGTGSRNFTLGQILYSYDVRNRSVLPAVDGNGRPSLLTYPADQDLQATLQHVVVTYDQYRGRRVHVNGIFTDDVDEQGPGRLWNWDPNHTFALGNEISNDRLWLGKLQLVAVYDLALTPAQIQQNFDAGVGKRLVMRFDVSAWAGPGSFIEFMVSEFDEFSYLFCQPTFVSPNAGGVRLSNLRIAVNGVVPVSGQAFQSVDALVTEPRQLLSRQCSIVQKDAGAADDVFSIEFETLAGFQDPVDPGPPPAPPVEIFGEPLPREGLRDFDRVNNTMASLTGVDPNSTAVRDTFAELEQQLPGTFDLRTFSSSQQVGIAKLALEYCDAMVESNALRTAFFGTTPPFQFDAPVNTAFSDQSKRDLVIDRLVDRMLGANIAYQPSRDEARPLLNDLITELTAACTTAPCDAVRTRNVVKGLCAAVLSSAASTVH